MSFYNILSILILANSLLLLAYFVFSKEDLFIFRITREVSIGISLVIILGAIYFSYLLGFRFSDLSHINSVAFSNKIGIISIICSLVISSLFIIGTELDQKRFLVSAWFLLVGSIVNILFVSSNITPLLFNSNKILQNEQNLHFAIIFSILLIILTILGLFLYRTKFKYIFYILVLFLPMFLFSVYEKDPKSATNKSKGIQSMFSQTQAATNDNIKNTYYFTTGNPTEYQVFTGKVPKEIKGKIKSLSPTEIIITIDGAKKEMSFKPHPNIVITDGKKQAELKNKLDVKVEYEDKDEPTALRITVNS